MRILVLTPTFLPAVGGAELVILQVYRRIGSRHPILVLTPYLSENLLKNTSSKEYDHLVNFSVQRYHDHLTLMKIRGHRISHGFIPPFSVSAVSAVQQAIRSFKPDVINVHYVMPTGFAGLCAEKAFRIPTVITYNGRDVPGPGVPLVWKYWHRLIGNNCSDMTFVSKYCRDVIYGRNSSLGHVIYNGVEDPVPVSTEQVSALKSRFEISDDEHILFSLQRLDFLKRVDVIIRSMPEILDKRPNTRLIIGGKGPDLARLQSIAAELGVDKSVVFPGFIPENEIPVYHTAADLFVFHSTYETFGIVLAEAMNYGTPVVSADNTAIPEVVDEGQTGLLVPTLDHKALADAAVQLLTDRRRREEMGRRAREKARRAFNWDLNSKRYERVLQSAAKGSSFHSGSWTDL